ncbi:MAG TPA: polysaccharide deacetylase family protein [Bacteroidales bacterium]|nr:polysaccharide deacetylase family protein [Bacteroidales bacterium]
MISVHIYNNFLNEKKYIFDFLFKEIFFCDYELIPDSEKSYRISDGNKTISIADSFFSAFEDEFLYYNDRNIVPDSIAYADYPKQEIFNTPVLFGTGELKVFEDICYLGNDIFAGLFFMLTRWEEIAVSKFDTHGRFDEEENLSVRLGFYDRPIVNEYILLLENLLHNFCTIQIKNKRKGKVFLTHDVDEIARYDTLFKILKALGGDIVKRKSLSTFLGTLKDCYSIKTKKQSDVYDTFDLLMDLSDKKAVKSRFYFIPGYNGEVDVRFDIRNSKIKNITEKIKLRGHIIGIHPSYSSFCNKTQLIKEQERLKQYCGNIEEGRQHYLRFKIPDTWQDWEDTNLKVDSSIGFYNRIGFRAGICYEYPVFNVVTRKQLNVRERPLLVMDTALRKLCVTKEKSVETVFKLHEYIKKYNGDFVLLWHNNNLKVNEWAGWDKVYKQIIEQV